LLAHGHKVFPSQHPWGVAATLGQESVESTATDGWIKESWITSPRNKPTMDFKTITWIRVTQRASIPIFFSEKEDLDKMKSAPPRIIFLRAS
jgi:hypothetical protein